MFSYIARRSLYMIPTVFGITLLTFLLFHIFGGDPALQAAGKHVSPEQIKILQHEMGLDLPMYQQYLFFLKQILSFDFGSSWATHQKISTMVLDGLGPSLSLTI